MIELSEKICQINGILGAAILYQNDEIAAMTCLSEMAQQLLDGIAHAMRRTISDCEVHEPGLQALSAKAKDFTIVTRLYSPWAVCAVCQNDQILFLLESSIDAVVAEHLQKLESESPQPGQVWLRARKRQEEENALSPLCEEVLRLARPYFAQPQIAERLILRQIREHLKVRPDDLNHTHVEALADWVNVSSALILDAVSARGLSDKIREIR